MINFSGGWLRKGGVTSTGNQHEGSGKPLRLQRHHAAHLQLGGVHHLLQGEKLQEHFCAPKVKLRAIIPKVEGSNPSDSWYLGYDMKHLKGDELEPCPPSDTKRKKASDVLFALVS